MTFSARMLSCVQFIVTLWTAVCQAPLSMGFFRQEYWSGLHALFQGIFPTQGSSPVSPSLQADSLLLSHWGSLYRTLGNSFDHCKHVFFFKSMFAFELWCWRRLLRVSWTARRSNQSILKEISPEYSLEGLMLKLKLQYFGTLCKDLTHWKRP